MDDLGVPLWLRNPPHVQLDDLKCGHMTFPRCSLALTSQASPSAILEESRTTCWIWIEKIEKIEKSCKAFFGSHHIFHHRSSSLKIWQCVKTLYACSSHQNSWDLWMFIPLRMVLIGIDPYTFHKSEKTRPTDCPMACTVNHLQDLVSLEKGADFTQNWGYPKITRWYICIYIICIYIYTYIYNIYNI